MLLTMTTHVGVVDLGEGIVMCPHPVPASTLGFFSWLKNNAGISVGFDASADVVSSTEALLSEPLGGGCCNGQGGHWFCGQL
jgi:hypothetical protein